eukprot:5444304-Karenia_brevis.AAC.1
MMQKEQGIMSGPEYDEPVVTPVKKDVKAVENENVKNVSVEKAEKPKTKGGTIAIEEDEAEDVPKRKSSANHLL